MHVLYALALLLVASAAHLVASLDQVNPVAAAAVDPVADCSYPYQNYTCCVSACERPGGLPYACVAACAPVDCSVKGNCFNISGAHDFRPPVPTGTDLNGLYTKTPTKCSGKNVYQKDGCQALGPLQGPCPVLYLNVDHYPPPLPSLSTWYVSSSDAADCVGGITNYLSSSTYAAEGSCPSSPDGAGCVGKWGESDHNENIQPNPAIRVVDASGAR